MKLQQLMRPAARPAVLAVVMSLGLGVMGSPAAGQEQGGLDPEADRILQAMTRYLGDLPAFSAATDVDQEIITRAGQKLQFSSSGTILVQRPDRFHATRRGRAGNAELFLDAGTVTIAMNDGSTYLQIASPGGIDEAIDAVRGETGLDLSGADLLYADVYTGLMTDVTESAYIGTGFVDGVECDHLAFRAAKVDWQIWIRTGDAPLPMKYVITSTWVTGAPQYSIRLRDWNVNPSIDAAAFRFTPPAGAKKVDAIAVNQIDEPMNR